MQAKDLIVLGSSRLLGKIYCGDIDIGGTASFSGKITTNQLVVSSSTDISGTSTPGTAPFVVGNISGAHIEIDPDEIMAKNNAATSHLYLNYNGGNVYLSGSTIYASGSTMYGTTFSGTTGNITNVNSNTITNQTSFTNKGNIYNINGRIETDQIRSNVWDIVSTQNLGGNFFVAPTIMIKDGSTVTITSVSGNTIVGTIKDTTNITSNSFGGHTWSSSSKIKITGKLTSGSNNYILGVCDGTLTANMNTTANTINFSVTCNATTKPPTGTYTITDGTVMMYSVGSSNKVGIYMTCYGTDKYTYIDIYNGSNGNKPVARLGKLDNLGTTHGVTVNGENPAGYGLFTSNGYYEGKIVANGGKIGGYTIGTANLTKGTTQNADGSFWLTPEGQSTNMSTLNNGALTWALTVGQKFGVTTNGQVYATGGKIGGWTIDTTKLYSGGHSTWNSTDQNGIYLGNDGVAGGSGGIWYLWKDGSAKIGAMTLSAAGVLTVPAANITGELTAATISGSKITANTITSTQIAAGSITASRLQITDFTNYCQLNQNTANLYGWTYTEDSSNPNTPWYVRQTLARDNYPSEWFECKQGDTFKVSMTVSSTVTGATSSGGSGGTYMGINIGVHTQTATGTSSWLVFTIVTSSSAGTETTKTGYVTIPSGGYIKFRAFIQIGGWAPFTGTLKIRNPVIQRVGADEYITNIDSNKGITIKPSDSSGNDYLQINSSSIDFYRNNNSVTSLSDDTFRMGLASSGHSTVKSDGLHIWTGAESTATNEKAFFGATARIGQNNTQRLELTSSGVDIYTSDNQKRMVINSSTGVIIGRSDKNHTLLNDDTLTFYNASGTATSTFGNSILLGSNGASITLGSTSGTNANTVISTTGIQMKKGSNAYVDLNSSGNLILGLASSGHSKITSQGLYIYTGTESDANNVAFFGSTARIGVGTNSNHFDFNSNSIKYINANNNQIFAVTQGNTANTWRQKTVVSYAENVAATATSYTINDSNITNTKAPYTTLTINGDTYNFSTGITCTVTNGSKVVVAISSAGVTAIQEERRYVQTTYTYAATNDTTVNASKTYYSKSGDTYTVVDVDPDATVNPKTSGWYEATLTETTKYYPCVVSVNYIIQTTDNVNLQVKGIIKIDSDGFGIDITNNKWTSSNLSDTMIRFTNASTGTNVCCGVGSGGQNHGIFSGTLNQWIIYADQNGKAYIPPSNLQVQNLTTKNITASGNIFSVKTKDYAYIKAQSNSGFIQLYASNVKDGNRGIAVRNANNSEVIPVQVNGSNDVRINATTIFRTGGRAIYNYSAQTGKKLFCFGNNAQTLRFATKTTSSTSQGISFMIGNGYYAVGSGGSIDRTNTNMYFGGGYGDDGRFVFSPPIRARTYSSNPGTVVVTESGVLGRYSSSSIRYKHDVEYLTNEENATIEESKKLIKRKLLKGTNNSNSDITDILNLPVVKFKFNEGYISGELDYDYSKPVVGLIADDVAAICPDIATYIKDKDGNKIPESYDTTKIVVRMLYIVQQMNKRIQALEKENQNLYNQLNK